MITHAIRRLVPVFCLSLAMSGQALACSLTITSIGVSVTGPNSAWYNEPVGASATGSYQTHLDGVTIDHTDLEYL